MVSALRRMIEESNTLTEEAAVNHKRCLSAQLVDLQWVHTLLCFRSSLALISGESTLQHS